MQRYLHHLVWVLLVVSSAGCGSRSQPSSAPTTPSPCASMAAHVAGNVADADAQVVVEKVMRESCDLDGWSAEGIDCLSQSTGDLMALVPEQSREQRLAGCGATLTEAQLEGISTRFAAEIEARASSN